MSEMSLHTLKDYQLPEEEGASMAAESSVAAQQYAEDLRYGMQVLSSASPKMLHDIVVYINNYPKENSVAVKRDMFYTHYKKWEEETLLISDTSIIRSNPHFKAMVALGEDIVPFIIEELRKAPSHLNWVLTEIYHTPISNRHITNSEACRLWIEKFSA